MSLANALRRSNSGLALVSILQYTGETVVSGADETVLNAVDVPAGTFTTPGDAIEFDYVGRFDDSIHNLVTLKLGAQNLVLIDTAATTDEGSWSISGRIVAASVDLANQRCTATVIVPSNVRAAGVTMTLDLSVDQDLTLLGDGPVEGGISFHQAYVKFFSVAP
jgi:hypothetical protein